MGVFIGIRRLSRCPCSSFGSDKRTPNSVTPVLSATRLGAAPRLAPLYDVSTALPWPSVAQFFAQNIEGRKRKPGDVAARHWDALAETVGYRPADVRDRVRQLADAFVGKRVATTQAVAALAGRTRGYVEEAARLIEDNALRIAGRLRAARPRQAKLPD